MVDEELPVESLGIFGSKRNAIQACVNYLTDCEDVNKKELLWACDELEKGYIYPIYLGGDTYSFLRIEEK
jgi:hypothetical protein